MRFAMDRRLAARCLLEALQLAKIDDPIRTANRRNICIMPCSAAIESLLNDVLATRLTKFSAAFRLFSGPSQFIISISRIFSSSCSASRRFSPRFRQPVRSESATKPQGRTRSGRSPPDTQAQTLHRNTSTAINKRQRRRNVLQEADRHDAQPLHRLRKADQRQLGDQRRSETTSVFVAIAMPKTQPTSRFPETEESRGRSAPASTSPPSNRPFPRPAHACETP